MSQPYRHLRPVLGIALLILLLWLSSVSPWEFGVACTSTKEDFVFNIIIASHCIYYSTGTRGIIVG
jgi:hypothetical protein